MAKSANQKLRLLHLAEILVKESSESHPLSRAEITALLERRGITCERKTFYDDVCALQDWGLDIISRREKSTLYYTDGYLFSLPELKLLIDAVQASKFMTEKKSLELIRKLETFTSRQNATGLRSKVLVSNRVKSMNESIYYNIDSIHEAIMKNRQISFVYYIWTLSKERVPKKGGDLYIVSPWALVWDDENYYLVARDERTGEKRHYRVDNMGKISVTKEKRGGAEQFEKLDMADYSKQTFGMFGGTPEPISLLCDGALIGVMLDRFGKDLTVIPAENNRFKISFRAVISPVFLSWIFSFGARVRLLSPQHCIADLIAAAKKVVSVYDNTEKNETGGALK